jgi:hypothetical protein
VFPKTVDDSWISALSDEDVAFLKRFILASGSLKDLAAAYDVSYPTIRLRLDRLVEKVRLLDRKKKASRFEKLLLTQFADGKLDEATMRTLLTAHEQELAAGGLSKGESETNASTAGHA